MNTPELVSDIHVVVPFHNNVSGLAATLIMLQSQIVPPRGILVVDTSPNKLGLALSKRYYTDTIPVYCALAPQKTIYEAWNIGIGLTPEPISGDILFINDDLLLPLNFIDALDAGREQMKALAYVPLTPPREHYSERVDMPFYWYANNPKVEGDMKPVDWMTGFCFLLTRQAIKEVGTFDTQFKVWYGDTDYERRLHNAAKRLNMPAVAQVQTAFAYHYGGSSYKYQRNKGAQQDIISDKEKFEAKYSHD